MTTPVPAWASAIKKADEVGPPRSIFLYGVPGTRKTSIAASIRKVPGFDKVLFIDTDGGDAVLSLDPAYADIDIVSIDPLDPDALAKIDSIIQDVSTNDYGYKAVVLDTLSIAQDAAERALKDKHANTKNTFAVYGELGDWTDATVRRLHNADHFVGIVTCHSTEKRLETGAIDVKPKLSGASKDSIGAVPDLVAHLSYARHPETGDNHLVANIGQTDGLISKNRWMLDPIVLDFDLPKLYELVSQKINKPLARAA